jgi:phage repressor protein C with HTH and peptisase S24 domain
VWQRISVALGRRDSAWLSRESSVATSTIGDIKNRGVIPRADRAIRIAKALDSTVEHLFGGQPEAEPEPTPTPALTPGQLAARVRDAAKARKLTPSRLSKPLPIEADEFARYWKGEEPWPDAYLPPLAEALGTTVEALTGASPLPSPARPAPVAPPPLVITTNSDDLVELKEVDLAYGLGETFADDEVEVETHRFPRAWLEKLTATPASSLFIARGRGDSMQPTIQDGEMLLIDCSQRNVRELDAIWALTIGQFATVKRVRGRGERVQLLSDNDRVPPDEYHHQELNIVGRVIYVLKRV